ncbi:hypothetical protein KUTeg_019091 [Tegillarca granosa]|uniref:Transglutaminase-like domain-containing protein n=1 Tax=Tegillarca granosa TaxID=220873 RepID=A0ABQ9EGP2_TEGGR|nr:hypothetical protein KUTeg_019091 [Tegillarca granosa]
MAWLKRARKTMNEEKIKKEEEEREKDVEIIPENEPIEVIHVKWVDLHIPANTKDHHTNRYYVTDKNRNKGKLELVVRRGQEFKMTILFDRPYDKNNDDIKLVFEIGLKGSLTKETLAMLELEDKQAENTDDWNARVLGQKGNEVELMILTPNDCIIGEWTFDVITQFVDNKDVVNQICYEYPENINIILNPWCKDDTCYMEKEEDRNEYVLNDDGYVFQGSAGQIYTKPWHFGQYDKDILDISLRLLRVGFGGNITNKMADPVMISRTIAMVVNACDEDEGVLVGNWSGDYEGGRTPSSWSGSAKILQKFLKDKQSVKYGQCWVFSAVTVAVCRALGMPCRSVTNFGSAHDTDGSVTIDWLYEKNEHGKLEKKSGGDSIWNFHVWNECWFERPDLPPGYGGWQVIDATPQERSEGVFTCGPASVTAIKKGELSMPYDAAFVFAEVNADIKKFEVLGGYQFDPLGEITDRVGKKISTKKIRSGNDGEGASLRNLFDPDRNREDVTCNYKFPEGSKEERKAVENAVKHAQFSYGDYVAPPKDLEVKLTDIDRVMIGEDLTVEVIVKNISESKERRTISVLTVEIYCCTYTGEPVGEAIKFDEHIGIELNYNECSRKLQSWGSNRL